MTSFRILAINMDDRPDKWDSLLERFHVPVERVSGVDLGRHPTLYTEAVVNGKHPDVPLTKTGWVGLGLAHLKAWELVAQRTTPHLILEDDVRPNENWSDAIEFLSRTFSDFDLFLLNALRPHGVDVGHGVIQVDTSVDAHAFRGRMSNVWLSSYLLSPKGAASLLQIVKRAQHDLNHIQFDHALMRALGKSNANVYVVSTTNRYFLHDETDSDKERLNQQRRTDKERLPKGEVVLPIVLFGLLLLVLVFAYGRTRVPRKTRT